MRKRPFFFIGLTSFCVAILCAFYPTKETIFATAFAAVLLIALSCIKRLHLPLFTMTTAGVCAVLVSLAFYINVQKNVLPQIALDGTTANVTMRVESAVATTNAYIVKVESGSLPKGVRLCFWPTYLDVAPENGDLLTAEVDLLAAYDSQSESGATAMANGVYLYAWPVENSVVTWDDGQDDLFFLTKAVYRLQRAVHDRVYRHMSFEGAAFSEGMMLGNCGNISARVGNAFRTGGVYHLLAVSGSHLVLISAVVFWLLRLMRCSQGWCATLTAMVILLFMALCGFASSINRAGVMALLMLSGYWFRRQSDGLNFIGFTTAAMLIADPFCLYDIGWQLSFAATLGLIVFAPIWQKEVVVRLKRIMPKAAPVVQMIGSAVGVTLCASLTTLPLTAWHFGGISGTFLIGNLVCVPLSELLLLVNFAAVLTMWVPMLSQALFWVSEWIGRLMSFFVVQISFLPLSLIWVGHPLLIVWMVTLLLLAAVSYRLRRMRGVLAVTLVMALVLVGGVRAYRALTKDTTTIYTAASNRTVAVVRASDGTCGLITEASGEAFKKASMLLYDQGVLSLDWVLWIADSSYAVDVTPLAIDIERLLITSPREDFMNLPNAKVVTVLEDGGAFRLNTDTMLERCGNFWRLQSGQTSCLIAAKNAQTKMLPSAWREADLLLFDEIPDGGDTLTADFTVMFCAHSERDLFSESFPDAAIAIEGGTKTFLTSGDGNITLRK